jgi:hypothetical protein
LACCTGGGLLIATAAAVGITAMAAGEAAEGPRKLTDASEWASVLHRARGAATGNGDPTFPGKGEPIRMRRSGQPESCPWDCAAKPDGIVSIGDLLALLSQWGGPGTCDFFGNGVGIDDLLELLNRWGLCPAPPNDECVGEIVIDEIEPDDITIVDFDLRGATPSPEPYACVDSPPETHADVWYCLVNDTNGDRLITITTEPIELFVEVSAGCGCPPGPLVACGPGLEGTGQFPMQNGERVKVRLVNHLDLPNDELEGSMIVLSESLPPDVSFFTDPDEFAAAAEAAGEVLEGSWDFTPNLVGADFVGPVDDPLNSASFPPDIWPSVPLDDVTFQSNLDPQGGSGPNPHGSEGLAFLTAPAFGIEGNALIANFFADSFDILSGPPAGDNHTAMAFDVIDVLPSPGGTIRVTVFDQDDNPLGQLTLPALDQNQFVGILTGNDFMIGRVNIWDDLGQSNQGAEGIARIELYDVGRGAGAKEERHEERGRD